jgi:hypothetical protein
VILLQGLYLKFMFNQGLNPGHTSLGTWQGRDYRHAKTHGRGTDFHFILAGDFSGDSINNQAYLIFFD